MRFRDWCAAASLAAVLCAGRAVSQTPPPPSGSGTPYPMDDGPVALPSGAVVRLLTVELAGTRGRAAPSTNVYYGGGGWRATGGPPRGDVLAPGARVRYATRRAPRHRRTDRVARASADTLWLASGRALPLESLARLEVSRGGRPELQRMLLGSAAGMAAGAVLGGLVPPDPDRYDAPTTQEETAVLGASLGMVVGGFAGLLLPGERWERVALPGGR